MYFKMDNKINKQYEFTGLDLEPTLLQILSELNTLRNSTHHEDALAATKRAEIAETARGAAERAACEARAEASAANSAAQQASLQIAKLVEEIGYYKMRADLADREKTALAEQCSTMSAKLNLTERECDELRNTSVTRSSFNNAYKELQQRSQSALERSEAAIRRLEAELRRVAEAAKSGAELRERARLAAGEHARHRDRLHHDLNNVTRQLNEALAENNKLRGELHDAKFSQRDDSVALERANATIEEWKKSTEELRSALQAERDVTAKLSIALAAATASASQLAAGAAVIQPMAVNVETSATTCDPKMNTESTNNAAITDIDAFLAD